MTPLVAGHELSRAENARAGRRSVQDRRAAQASRDIGIVELQRSAWMEAMLAGALTNPAPITTAEIGRRIGFRDITVKRTLCRYPSADAERWNRLQEPDDACRFG